MSNNTGKGNKWEQWKESKEGIKTMSALKSMCPDKSKHQYVENCLYWAFNAGNFPINGKLETMADRLLKDTIAYAHVSKVLKNRIKNYLEQNRI